MIIAAAIRLLESQGLEKLSMRKLGAELGVEAMSLYNHIKNKADLLNGIHESLLSQMGLPETDLSWQDAVKATARNFRNTLREHPAAIPLFASRSAIAPGSLAIVDTCIGILREAGFPPKQSLLVFQTMFAYVIGHCQFTYGQREESSYADQSQYAQYPNLCTLPSLTELEPEDEFELALSALVCGIEATTSD